MRRSRFAVAAVLLLCTGPTNAVDLTQVDRSIRKEPAYHANPGYCLLVFGQEAKDRVWLVLDGDTLYVDKNGNGDLTDDGAPTKAGAFEPSKHPIIARERAIKVGDLPVAGLTHTELSVSQIQ